PPRITSSALALHLVMPAAQIGAVDKLAGGVHLGNKRFPPPDRLLPEGALCRPESLVAWIDIPGDVGAAGSVNRNACPHGSPQFRGVDHRVATRAQLRDEGAVVRETGQVSVARAVHR